jgi:hypothetical protein
MSLSWNQRKLRLAALLKSGGDEDEEGLALDRLTHGQNVIGKTCMFLCSITTVDFSDIIPAKTVEVDSLRFGNPDLEVVGTLEVGQFGVVE